MEDVLDVYAGPYDKDFPVICMDESSIQLIVKVLPVSLLKLSLLVGKDTSR
jgi:hypothetical protein